MKNRLYLFSHNTEKSFRISSEKMNPLKILRKAKYTAI